MSEQFKQDQNSQGPEIDDDPLAELARIVAGEPELNSSASEKNIQTAEQEVSESSFMEAALEEQLLAEFSMENQPEIEMEAPAFAEDINASIEQINSEVVSVSEIQPETNFEPTIVQEPSVVESYQPEVANVESAATSEAGFEDGLISALEQEIVGQSEPQNVDEVSPIIGMPETQVEEVTQEAVAQVEDSVANMQETLEQELAAQMEPAQTLVEESIVSEPQVASIEDDLGAAFASEFEQMSDQNAEKVSESAVQEFVVEEPVVEIPVEPQPIVAQPDLVPAQADLEMDFEAAFAQELEGVEVPETQAWSETETVEASTAFSAGVAADTGIDADVQNQVNLDSMEYDPGHVGSVDDISAVEASPIVANDNGGGKKYAVAALVIALFAGVIAAGYGFLGGENSTVASGTPEIIKADADPVKIKPDDPGGLVPENQDNASYGDLGGENNVAVSQETLTSQTEEPIILNTGNTSEPVKSDDRLTASEDSGATPNAASSSVLPKVVQTVTVKPDGTIITKPSVPKPVETALNTVTIGDTSNVAVKPVETQTITKPNAIDGAKTTGDIKIPSASPLPKPVVKAQPAPAKKVAAAPKPKPAAPAPVRKSEWVVQVSSQTTPEAAQASFANMRNKFSALQGRAMAIQRANVNGTTYYRVRVQTESRADANQLCSRLAAAGGNCFVTR